MLDLIIAGGKKAGRTIPGGGARRSRGKALHQRTQITTTRAQPPLSALHLD